MYLWFLEHDVVNPAAHNIQPVPIYGMPIVWMLKMQTYHVNKLSHNQVMPGIRENELFLQSKTSMLFVMPSPPDGFGGELKNM